MSETNPFLGAAGDGAASDQARKEAWARKMAEWEGYVTACTELMEEGIMRRLRLAESAAIHHGFKVIITGIARTETWSGTTHLRAKIILESDTERTAQLEFIGSPKSGVIGVEGGRAYESKRWKNVPLSGNGIESSVEAIIEEFLAWGVGY